MQGSINTNTDIDTTSPNKAFSIRLIGGLTDNNATAAHSKAMNFEIQRGNKIKGYKFKNDDDKKKNKIIGIVQLIKKDNKGNILYYNVIDKDGNSYSLDPKNIEKLNFNSRSQSIGLNVYESKHILSFEKFINMK